MIQADFNSDEYSEEDFDSLHTHIKTKRPRLARFIEQLRPIGAKIWKNGFWPDNFDVDAFNSQVQEALAAEQSKAALDNCIWASMEWKWQT
jgi:hypothetical protein